VRKQVKPTWAGLLSKPCHSPKPKSSEAGMCIINRVGHVNERRVLMIFLLTMMLSGVVGGYNFYVSAHRRAAVAPRRTTLVQNQNSDKSFRPDKQTLIAKESGAIRVALMSATPCAECEGQQAFTFKVTDTREGTTTTFTVQNETAQVDEILIVSSSRAVILGSYSGVARTANIVDLKKGAVLDFFYCHYPTLSADGRFLAYVNYIPRFSSLSGGSFDYRVYDLQASPEQNRLGLAGRGPAANAELENQTNVGLSVYPTTVLQEGSSNEKPDDERPVHTLASEGLFWINGDVLAFVDQLYVNHSNVKNNLVLVDVNLGVDKPKVKVIPVPTAQVLNLSSCGKSDARPESLVAVTKISTAKQGAIRLHFRMRECLISPTLDLETQ
jgi:hypothetical protein